MKTTITGWLVLNAIDHINDAYSANRENLPDDEVRFSVGAHLMIALAIEGIGNEVANVALDTWTRDRLEKTETPLKWRILSGVAGRTPFDPGKEPLQTVQHLVTLRNEIAHPKIQEGGDEIIVRSKTGKIVRNVPDDRRLEDGDTVYLALGKLLDTYNCKTAAQATQRAITAMKKLRDHLEISRLDWIDEVERKLQDTLNKWKL
jgi:hypothetical protein